MYTQASRQGQSRQGQSWQRGTAAPGNLRLPLGEFVLQGRGSELSGLWGFEAEGTAYTIKRRQAGSTKPLLYIMAELKPKPAYLSSLYFISYAHTRDIGVTTGRDLFEAWSYVCQLPGQSSPVLFVSLLRFESFHSATTGEGEGARYAVLVSESADLLQAAFADSTDYECITAGAFC